METCNVNSEGSQECEERLKNGMKYEIKIDKKSLKELKELSDKLKKLQDSFARPDWLNPKISESLLNIAQQKNINNNDVNLNMIGFYQSILNSLLPKQTFQTQINNLNQTMQKLNDSNAKVYIFFIFIFLTFAFLFFFYNLVYFK